METFIKITQRSGQELLFCDQKKIYEQITILIPTHFFSFL